MTLSWNTVRLFVIQLHSWLKWHVRHFCVLILKSLKNISDTISVSSYSELKMTSYN